jgi:hypothetical protein
MIGRWDQCWAEGMDCGGDVGGGDCPDLGSEDG